MTKLYGLASRLSWWACGMCAVFAILAVPSTARADDASDCTMLCMGLPPMEYSACFSECLDKGGGKDGSGFTLCKYGNPDCLIYTTKDDCYPYFSNKCFNSNPNCACRWAPKIGQDPGNPSAWFCYCSNITGG